MTRAALITALAIGFVFGLLCAVDPQLDLDLAAVGFDSSRHLFVVNAQPWAQHTRLAARILIALLALPAFLAILLKLIWPHRPMLIEARAALFLIATLALGPGLLTNVILKDHWGRPRPIDVRQFGGVERKGGKRESNGKKNPAQGDFHESSEQRLSQQTFWEARQLSCEILKPCLWSLSLPTMFLPSLLPTAEFHAVPISVLESGIATVQKVAL